MYIHVYTYIHTQTYVLIFTFWCFALKSVTILNLMASQVFLLTKFCCTWVWNDKLSVWRSSWAGSWCTYRGDEASVPLQHHVDVLHHAQQVKEATAGERRGWVISHRNQRDWKWLGRTSRGLFSRQTGEHSDTWVAQSPWWVSGLLVETLLVWIPQEPPVLPDFHQTLDFIAQLQIFIIQTLWRHAQGGREEKRRSRDTLKCYIAIKKAIIATDMLISDTLFFISSIFGAFCFRKTQQKW